MALRVKHDANGDKEGPFCPIRLPYIGLRFFLLVLAAFITPFVGATAFAEETKEIPPGESFMKLSPGQRYWWIEGAILTTSHVVAIQNKEKGSCVAKWYIKDEAAKQALIEATIVKYPTEVPTTLILALLTRSCGPLILK